MRKRKDVKPGSFLVSLLMEMIWENSLISYTGMPWYILICSLEKVEFIQYFSFF